MEEGERYAVGIILALRGWQNTSVKAHDIGTGSARVGVRIGTSLIYVADYGSARALATAWRSCTAKATSLPRVAPTTVVVPDGINRPAVSVDIAGQPPMAADLYRPRGRPSFITFRVGQLHFHVRDQAALTSVVDAFERAEHLGRTAFGRPIGRTVTPQDARASAVALPPPRLGPRVGDRDRYRPPGARSAAPRPPTRSDPGLGR